MNNIFACTGRVALVTGSSGDIGAGIATALADNGADIVVHYVASKSRAEAVASDIRDRGRRAIALGADLRDPKAVTTMIENASRELGPIDIVINNAGVRRKTGDHKYILEVTDEEWDVELDSHLKAAFLVCKAALPSMIERRWGRIINISSVVAKSGGVGASVHYPAAKGGIISFTKALATQIAKNGITANVLSPGIIDTERVRWRSPAQMQEHIDKIPVGRLGQVAEIAAAAVYLSSEPAAYVTGATLEINGGLYMA